MTRLREIPGPRAEELLARYAIALAEKRIAESGGEKEARHAAGREAIRGLAAELPGLERRKRLRVLLNLARLGHQANLPEEADRALEAYIELAMKIERDGGS